MNTYDYDHGREKAYISNISDAFQKAEEETRKAEQMLEKWRRVGQQQPSQQVSLQATDVRTMPTAGTNESQGELLTRINSLRKNLGMQQANDMDQQKSYKRNRSEVNVRSTKAEGHGQDRRQLAAKIIANDVESSFSQVETNKSYQKNLDPQILDSFSQMQRTEDDRKSIRQGLSHRSNVRKPLLQLNTVQNDTDLNISNYSSKHGNITILTDATHQNLSYSNHELRKIDSVSSKTTFEQVEERSANYTNISKQRESKGVNKYLSTKDEEDYITSNTVEKETEIILLDKHYRALMRTEKEEYQKKLQKQMQLAQKEAEKKFRMQLSEMREKVESLDRLELDRSKLKLQNDKLLKDNENLRKKLKTSEQKADSYEKHMSVLQKKLDDLWERQKLEKDNTRLITKYELEQESQKVLNDFSFKVRELEESLRLKERVNKELQDQCEDLKESLGVFRQKAHDSMISHEVSRSQDKINEYEMQQLQLQNSHLIQQLEKIDMETSNKVSINSELEDKYQLLKKKFALLIKEKEDLERNRLMETAKFKESQRQIRHCEGCERWKTRAAELSERYFDLIQKLREDIEALRLENQRQIAKAQMEVHKVIVSKLKDYLRNDSPQERKSVGREQRSKSCASDQRASSIVVYSEESQAIQRKEPSMQDNFGKRFQNQLATGQTVRTTSRKGKTSRTKKYMNTIDDSSKENRSHNKMKKDANTLELIQNSMMHKTITGSMKSGFSKRPSSLNGVAPKKRKSKKLKSKNSIVGTVSLRNKITNL